MVCPINSGLLPRRWRLYERGDRLRRCRNLTPRSLSTRDKQHYINQHVGTIQKTRINLGQQILDSTAGTILRTTYGVFVPQRSSLLRTVGWLGTALIYSHAHLNVDYLEPQALPHFTGRRPFGLLVDFTFARLKTNR